MPILAIASSLIFTTRTKIQTQYSPSLIAHYIPSIAEAAMKTIDKVISLPFYLLGHLVGAVVRALRLIKAALREGYENGARIA